MPTIPTEEQQTQIHAGLLDRTDLTAFLNAYNVLKDMLITFLHAQYSTQPEDCEEIVADVLESYMRHPEKFDPSRSTLISYLRMAAEGDIRNLLVKQKRRKKHESISLDNDEQFDVADRLATGNSDQQGESVEEQVERLLATARVDSLLPQLSSQDRQILNLMADGARETTIFAEVLDITHLNFAEQQRRVKREKDRLRKFVQRHIDKDELES